MSPPTLPLRAIAALFIERQHLDRPRARRLTASSLTRFVEDVGGIQLDSINVVERAHHLTLWSRFGPYERKAFERLAYRKRVLFEYWAHAACLVSVGYLPNWRHAMLDYSTRSRRWGAWLKKHRRTLNQVEQAIRDRGPLANADFEHPGKRVGAGWWNWKPAAHALDYLWMSGRTLVHSRQHFQKRFDLAERVLPQVATLDVPSREAFRLWHIRRSLHAMGAATETDLRMYLTFPRLEVAERKQALRSLLDAGEVVEIAAAGDRGRWYALAQDLPALARAGRRRAPASGTTLLAPFDSFLWHRERTSRLFGFDYRIEVYTPGHKRVHGYYSLPLYHEGQLIGRIDLKTHRAERRLEVKAAHFERWFATGGKPPAAAWGPVDRDAALAGTAAALRSLAAFVGADDVSLGRVTPGALRTPLRRALSEARGIAPKGASGSDSDPTDDATADLVGR